MEPAYSQNQSWRYRPWVMVWPVAMTQLISWGCIYYAFAVFIVPLEAEFGWSKQSINLALTLALLVMAVTTYPLARYLDRKGGWLPMSLAAGIAAMLLLALSQIHSYTAFLALWVMLGICMSALLYEPAFVVVTQVFGNQARVGITALTLVAGFSSTVFIPMTEFAVQSLGWRDTLVWLAVIMAGIVLPLHLLFIPPQRIKPAGHDDRANHFGLARLLREPVYWGLAAWASLHAFMLVGLFFQLVPWLKSEGVATNVIVVAIAVMGPMQVAGRLLVMLFGKNVAVAGVGVVTTMLFPCAIYLLAYGAKTTAVLCVAIGLFGMANGITTILRGAIPAEWFVPEHYARVAGAIAVPAITLGALAPFAFAFVWERQGDSSMLVLAIGVSIASCASFIFAVYAKHRTAGLL